MPAPTRPRALRKDGFSAAYKSLKPVIYPDTPTYPKNQTPPSIRSITWSPTGSMVATCTNTTIRIWSPEKPSFRSSTEIRNAHPRASSTSSSTIGEIVEKVSFCPNTDNLLASVGQDGYLRLWDVRVAGGAVGSGKGTPMADYKAGKETTFVSWHPSGTELLVGCHNSLIHAVDLRRVENEPIAYSAAGSDCTPSGRSSFTTMTFSNSGREVFAATREGEVRILDYPSMEQVHALSGHLAPTYTVQHSPTGSCVAVGSADSLISIWDTYSWLCTHTINKHMCSVRDLSFSCDGQYLVVGNGTDYKEANTGLTVYHVDTGDAVHTVDTRYQVTHVAWHPLRYWIAYAGESGGMHIVGAGSHY